MSSSGIEAGLAAHKRALIFTALGLVLLTVGMFALRAYLLPVARREIAHAVGDLYPGEVEVGPVHVSVFPSVHITGENVVVRPKGQPNAAPLVTLPKYSVDAGLFGLWKTPRHFRRVTVDHLRMQLKRGEGPWTPQHAGAHHFQVDEIVADESVLQLFSSVPGEPSHDFLFHHGVFRFRGPDQPTSFQVRVSVPQPFGDLEGSGEVGPQRSPAFKDLPISGTFRLMHANLGSLKGMAGELSTNGKFRGVVGNANIEGTSDSPNFTVKKGNHPMRLTTEFRATMNGENGDTVIHSLHGRFLRSSVFVTGTVLGTRGVPGKHILLHGVFEKARVQDLLSLAVKQPAPVTGVTNLNVHLDLPPGDSSPWHRLKLDGAVGIAEGHLTKASAQEKLNSLSEKAEGDPKGAEENVLSDLSGPYSMRDGIVSSSHLTFSLPGASALLHGTYNVRSKDLQFEGTLRMAAKVSQTTTGFKSFLLKAVDPFFKKKNAGAALPVKVGGTIEHPTYKVDIF